VLPMAYVDGPEAWLPALQGRGYRIAAPGAEDAAED
jgi:hypothetical protein